MCAIYVVAIWGQAFAGQRHPVGLKTQCNGYPGVGVKGINEPFMDVDHMIYQLKYDSAHRRYAGTVCSKKDGDKVYLVVNGIEVQAFNSKDPTAIPWGASGADYICESTGVFSIMDPFKDVDYKLDQLKYDSVHKRYSCTVYSKKNGDKVYLVVYGIEVQVFNSKDPTAIPQGACGEDYICESTGVFH
jgi:glyceraldehyde-3-phosphate dehydrogenase/erythrose-4-phosphate dehydrogenase